MKNLLLYLILACCLLFQQQIKAQCTVEASHDTTICSGGMAYLGVTADFLMLDYVWSPAWGLNATYLQYPVTHPNQDMVYYVSVTTLLDSNLIINGDFELGNTGFTSNYTFNATSVWAEGTYSVTTNPFLVHSNFSPCTDHTTGTGKMMVVNGAAMANSSIWCETVTVLPNTNYAFSTWLTSVHPTNPAVLQFSINGNVLGSPFSGITTTCVWQQFYEIWNSGNSTTAQICIVNQNTALDGNDFALDDISFKPFCVAVDSVKVTIAHVPADAGPDTHVCQGDPVMLLASGGVAYHWDSGHQTASVLLHPATDTIYYVTVTDAQSCKGEDSVRVYLWPLPVVDAGPDQHICDGDTALLEVLPGLSYQWTTGDTSRQVRVVPPATTIYYVIATDSNYCHAYDSLFVWIRPKPNISVSPDTSICPETTVELHAYGGEQYHWYPHETLSDSSGASVISTPTDSITYYVTGTDMYGCKNEAHVKVEFLECGITIPNVFTPNDDMKNDVFEIDYDGFRAYYLRIYDRWGRIVFTSNNKDTFWDGTIHGEPASEGVYYYVLMLDKEVHKGSVTLIR